MKRIFQEGNNYYNAAIVAIKINNVNNVNRASKETARTFHAASIFISTLEQFGELSSDVNNS